MPSLDWIGKKAVLNHHKEVPFHLLRCDPDLSVGEPDSGNLLVQGDNLLALKALLPYYAGQVRCIYIDPPYNTGNEKWVYNDNVNSPEMREWLGKVVGMESEDLSRHDKWLCMMYPRLRLLKDFLAEDGSIWISIDDNEVSSLRFLMDEIFGRNNFIAHFIWEKRKFRENRRSFSFKHDIIIAYANNKQLFEQARNLLPLSNAVKERYKNPDNDPRGPWQSVSANAQAGHATMAQFYCLKTPSGKILPPPPGRCWLYTKEKMEQEIANGNIWFGKSGNNAPRIKKFLSEADKGGLTPETIWYAEDVGTNDEAKKILIDIFEKKELFDTPKPTRLLQRIIQIATDKDSLVMDSFAGSGTTGHAVLAQNKADGGNRRFILVEMDKEICGNVTAQRLARVSQGYKDIEPLGGGFQYCRLGETLFDSIGQIAETVSFIDLARFVFLKETGLPLPDKISGKSPLIGVHEGVAVYLLYNGVLDDKTAPGGNALTRAVLDVLPPHYGPKTIYGTSCRVGQSRLAQEQITFHQIPYALKVD
ncbi:MAG TPA: site-specific DNA-methyltransferase [Methylomicrobium sp.]|nr:site-specific DNA-methyltransferase [Methylomicrobium sp.]